MQHEDGLWHLAKKFDIKNAGVMKKIDAIDALHKAHGVWDFCKDNEPAGNVHRKTRHCPFRLLNVLFSDKFSDDFGRLGDVATASQLTEGDMKSKVFWTRVKEAFLDPDDSCRVLHFTNSEIHQGGIDVNPSKIQQRNWEELLKIHHNVQKCWKEAVGGQTRSGMCDDHFCNFCGGFEDAHCLHKWLEIEPGLTDSMTATLPPNCAVESNEEHVENFMQTQTPSLSSASRHLKEGKTEEMLADVVSKLKAPFRDPQLTKSRQDLLRQEAQQEAKDVAGKDQEIALEGHQQVNSMIREVWKQLEDVTVPGECEGMSKTNLDGCIRRKNQLPVDLGHSAAKPTFSTPSQSQFQQAQQKRRWQLQRGRRLQLRRGKQ